MVRVAEGEWGVNPVLVLTRNNLELTKRCVASLETQDMPVEVAILDNDSTDGTEEWMGSSDKYYLMRYSPQLGVSAGWNAGFDFLFGFPEVAQILCCGNDTILAPWTYSALLSVDQPFVSGVDVGMSPLPPTPDIFPLSPHPDFSCFLIRRDCWEKVGPFDERMKLYVSDCDYHVRAHRLGVPLWKASVPYQHSRSSTMNRATPQERHAIAEQANRDRAVFKELYGCLPGTAAYNDLFKEPCGQTSRG